MLARVPALRQTAWRLVGGLFVLVAIVAAAGAAILGAWWIGTEISVFWAILFVLLGWPLIFAIGYWVGLLLFIPLGIILRILVGAPPEE